MQDLSDKTAVVTGAASGMGRAFANRFAREGMNVVLSDIEAPKLDDAVAEVAAHGTRVIGQITDVADGAAVDQLADLAFESSAACTCCATTPALPKPQPGLHLGRRGSG